MLYLGMDIGGTAIKSGLIDDDGNLLESRKVPTVTDDLDGFGAEAAEGRMLGFDGKSLIHPSQIAPCHAAFAPSQEEIARARRLVEAASGGAERFEGEMIERMHVESAERLLARHGRG